MKFLVLGATGRTGVLFVTKALDEGHQVTALVRRAGSSVDPRAHIVTGDVADAAVIAKAAQGHDAIISALGVKSAGKTPTLITDMVQAVIESAKISGVDRFVLLSAFGVGDSLAKASWLVGPLFRTMLRKTYADKAASEVLLKASDLKWTLEYPGALNNGDSTHYSTVALEDVKRTPIFPSASRTNVADFLLRSAVGNTFIRQIAVVLDAK
ncbi:NAD-dependent epimerase/dehydratase [Catenulispora acidiphila DSM 44928]|uniref:NAD-dependent epimerase/dehydratase n=1 Tax=Catenulispora acidiphila (strain DSM 44928 / JCM 14897 / NBRC 102108 / NRRL B-24433 / ID139908) TaxID=479433 RepID=C7PY79_CATAD|nr:NAD(P)-binding oxidoreductase [Catenulispora acidiphila]ACU75369.1 NAD-dependent epimerase/dehydratase [Catenulispora acidiphila DSM 44928]